MSAEASGGISTARNPLWTGLRRQRVPDACTLVIFGASGDLTHRKLVPSLYSLMVNDLLPAGFTILGQSRTSYRQEEFRASLRQALERHSDGLPVSEPLWESFSQGIFYEPGDSADPHSFRDLGRRLEEIEARRDIPANRIYYLAVGPNLYPGIIQGLGESGLATPNGGWRRVVVEKPFGRDLDSARQLNAKVRSVFQEEQIYRIDHYLGKETVQNLLVFRFGNAIWEPVWDRRYIDHVQINVTEDEGVGHRAGYYEQAGVVRDMFQNHLIQLLTFMAMEPPLSFRADAVRDEKVKVQRAVRAIAEDEVDRVAVRGQYGPGWANGQRVPGYRNEPKVPPDSSRETYAALKLYIDNWRWEGVPFYLRSGKRLAKKVTEIGIQFRKVPYLLFRNTRGQDIAPNTLTLRIQPDEGISLAFQAKVPGPDVTLRPVKMEFQYGTSFAHQPSTAYERLLLDCMVGDATLFTRGDEVEAAWALFTPVVRAWEERPAAGFPNYEAGTWGPEEAEAFMAADGRRWRRL